MITQFKIFENNNDNMVDVEEFIDSKFAQTLSDIRDDVKVGDKVLYTNFQGAFTTYIMTVEDLGEDFAKDTVRDYYDENSEYDYNDILKQCRLGSSDGMTVFTLAGAYFVFSYEDYLKLDPNFEIKMTTKKYNI